MPSGSSGGQDHSERRRYKRTHVLMAADLVSAQRTAKVFVLDISANGAQLQFPDALVPDSDIVLRMTQSVDLGVEVAWRSHNRLGLRFQDLPEKISSIFAGLLSEDCLVAA